MVCVADGTELAAQKLDRVLTSDPGMGVIRHVDAGYDRAVEVAEERGVRIPMRGMSVREIVTVGDPVLRERAREVTPEELRSAAVQQLIDDLIETKRAANGAGLAANQIGETLRVAVVEVEPGNPRYPYKPPVPLMRDRQPGARAGRRREVEIVEGCLSVPDLRGAVRASRRCGCATSTATAASTTRCGGG